ncbi:hypothetical protein QR680_011859 [Steinernema hermaphroditum]|uniref:Uncharacterized protein n=1 Tax=Steinernema hermaphroditum TaxID=289476 RepID=A0AA39I1I9_9BILA|nr:hypothetical protein QR680_011859 [Steinernema hermaphroditum]
MKYVYVVLALFLSVGYGCQPVVNDPSTNPGPEDVQKTDAPTEATTMSTPGGTTDKGEQFQMTYGDFIGQVSANKTTITPATETPSTPSDKGPGDEDEDLEKLIKKLMEAEQNINFVRDDIPAAVKAVNDQQEQYILAFKGENLKEIDEDIVAKMAADKAAENLATAQKELMTVEGLQQKANEDLKQAEKQRDEENDPAMKPAKEQAVKEAEKKLEEAKEAVNTAQEKNDMAVMEQAMKARDDLPSLEELQKKKEEIKKKDAEVVKSYDTALRESKRLGVKEEELAEEIVQLKKKIEQLKAKKKE